MQHKHMVYGEFHRHHYLVLYQKVNDDAYSTPLCHEIWNVHHKKIMLRIYLCYNKFSHLGVKHPHYPEHDTVCLSIFFPYLTKRLRKMYCNTNQLPGLLFCVPHSKPHGARGVNKHDHLCFDQKLCIGVCEILHIPCSCVACTSIINKPWISGIPPDKQERYKPVTNCTYWPVLGPFINWYIILFSSKSNSSDTFY